MIIPPHFFISSRPSVPSVFGTVCSSEEEKKLSLEESLKQYFKTRSEVDIETIITTKYKVVDRRNLFKRPDSEYDFYIYKKTWFGLKWKLIEKCSSANKLQQELMHYARKDLFKKLGTIEIPIDSVINEIIFDKL